MTSHLIKQEFKEAVARNGGPVPFSDFMQIALYHPRAGYYCRDRDRVGFGGSTDFFTASATGSVFTELVVEACRRLLAQEDPGHFAFVEIGAEPERGVLPERSPFKNSVQLRHGDAIEIPDRSVVFSNELFDAQPFHRLIFTGGIWREIGVAWEHGPVETILPELSPPVELIKDRLPREAAEGYHLDLPLAAVDLLKKIVTASSWRGLIVIFDYGKSWREMVEAAPRGTARAYRRHQQSNDLLTDPGEQDLTCHICWDWLIEVLSFHDFEMINLQSQEAFFVTHATPAIERIITAHPERFDARRQTLQQLIHPGNMGQKFQVLSARR